MDEFKKQFINDPTDLICRNKKFIKRQQKRQNQTESQTESPNRNNMSTEVDEDFMVASCSHKSTSTIMPIDSLQLINDKTKPNENHHLLHHGLDCSTLSNPPNLMIDNCFHIIGGYSPDQSSVTSSGVAMSSNDNLSTDLSINMNSAIENTPSTTLTDAHSSTELQSEFQQAATTNLSNDLTCSNALSSLSLNTRHCVTSTIKSERMNNTSTSNTFAYSSHTQAQSTPSLLWDEKRNSSSTDYKIKQQLTSSNVSTQTSFKKNVDIIESKVNHSANKRHDEKSVTTILTSTAPNLMVGSSTNPHYTISPPSSSHNSILGTSPLPSVFNCAATSCSQIFCTPLRTIVSQNRRRYQMDGFNLDLTYITDRIIAMGYPADTKEALYRNSMSHIVKFLEHYHPGHYKVFNLRGQYIYDPANFHNRVVSFEMTDHHPPRLELMAPFCREVHDYLNADPLNIVAVHCKAGKGRTGVMICAYLCYIAFYRTPRQNMDYYSIIRTHNNKGVTIPSQRRYVYYFAHLRQRNLNYMPLRCELVGIYLERPPKLSGTFSKGALKVRVACGDVDVFLGDDMWLNSEQYDEEEELHKRFPLTSNDDQYNPIHPETTKNCISRRCFGWTVPPNKRVFLEGDIRVDIFQKSRLKLFNVKQERKKIGHIWFNTMFTCPGFCGGPYIHGDEAFPYPESMIVRRHFRRKKREIRKESDCHMENFQQQKNEQLNTRRFSPSHPASAPTIAQDYISINEGTFDKVDLMHFKDAYISEALKKPSPSRSLIEAEKKGWQSQDGDTSQKLTTEIPPIKKQCRSSLDTPENEFEEEIVVDKPPGLHKHCPSTSLQAIYPNERSAPRYGVEELIREAFEKNLINDLYNTRRMSQPRDGPTIPKAIVGRPNANGPNCLIRNEDEHVGIFGVQEIDRAYKNKDIDSAFKVFILTRCIDESIPGDIRLCEQFIHVTLQKQEQKDLQKLEKLQQKQRKMMSGQQQSFKAQQTILNTSETPLEVGEGGLSKLGEMSQNINDPRITDPHYGKYFFRQRVTSHSKHPNVHHHCPLINIDVKICQQYGCLEMKNKNTLESNSAKNRTNLIIPKGTVRSNEELKSRFDLEDSNYAFDDFDFFHPRQETCSTIHEISKNDKVNSSLLHNENVVKKQRNEEMDVILASSSADDIPMIDKRILEIDDDPPIKILPKSKQMVSLTNTLLSSESNEPEVFHPSDCSLAPSTSSSCSSSDQSD